MTFIEEIRSITKMAEKKACTRGTKKVIKEVKKGIRERAMMGEYDATYCIPTGICFYRSKIEEYFTKEGFDCTIKIDFDGDFRIRVSWKEKNNENY